MTQTNADEDTFSIGNRIRDTRKALQLRQADLAEKVGISGSHLSDIERGALIPTIPTLQKIAQALDRPLEYFLAQADVPRSLGTVIPRMSMGDLPGAYFAQLVHDKTGGEISVHIYRHLMPSAVYQQVKGLVEGSIHIFIDDLFCFERYAPLCGIVFLPYFFNDREQYRRFLSSDIFQEHVTKRLLDQGARLLNGVSARQYGSFELLFSSAPTFTPDDLAGRKFRSYESDVADAWRRQLGAEPVRVVWDQQSYTAFEQGAIDTFLMPALHYASLDLQQVARYATVLDYGYLPSMIVAINEREYRKLSPDVQRALVEAVDETDDHFSRVVDAQARQFLDRLPTEYGVPVILPDQAIWRARIAEAVRQVCIGGGFLPQALYDALQAL